MTDQTAEPRCTCARSWNLHSRDCALYVEGHELASPELAAARQAVGQPAAATPVTLATPCDHCDHPLNWHGNSAACLFAFCGCGRFRAPAADAPAAGLAAPTNHDTEQQARNAVYSELMWPEWNPRAERHGMTADDANQLLDAYRAAILNSAADEAGKLRQFEKATGARKAAQISENVGILRVAEHLRHLATGAES